MSLGEHGGVDGDSVPRPSENQENVTGDPEDRDGLSDGSLKINTCYNCVCVCSDPPDRQSVGSLFPHSDVRTSQRHPETYKDDQRCPIRVRLISLRPQQRSPKVQETPAGLAVQDHRGDLRVPGTVRTTVSNQH